MPDLKSANHVVLQSSADPSLRVMVAEIEVSDVPMLSQQAIPVSQMVQIQLPSPSITAGQTVMLTTKLHDREALLEEVHWDLPTGWDVQSTDNMPCMYQWIVKVIGIRSACMPGRMMGKRWRLSVRYVCLHRLSVRVSHHKVSHPSCPMSC
jgi:hypothetical protein